MQIYLLKIFIIIPSHKNFLSGKIELKNGKKKKKNRQVTYGLPYWR